MGLPPLHVCALPPRTASSDDTNSIIARPRTPAETLASLPLKLLCEMVKARATVAETVRRESEGGDGAVATPSTDALRQRFDDCLHLFSAYTKYCEELREHVDDDYSCTASSTSRCEEASSFFGANEAHDADRMA